MNRIIPAFVFCSLLASCVVHAEARDAEPEQANAHVCNHDDTPRGTPIISYVTVSNSTVSTISDISTTGIIGKPISLDLGQHGIHAGTILNGFSYHFGGWYGWGLLNGTGSGYFTVSSKGDALVMRIETPTQSLTAQHVSTAPLDKIRVFTNSFDSVEQGHTISVYETTLSNQTGPTAQIDHLFVYSMDFIGINEPYDGTLSQITKDDATARMMHIMSNHNIDLLSSGISDVIARLAYAYESNLDSSVIIPSANDIGNSFVPEIEAVRSHVKADLGHYLGYTSPNNQGGSGTQAETYSGSPARWTIKSGFRQFPGKFGDSHETGHTMGIAHAPEDTSTTSVFSYGHGHCINSQYTTLMYVSGACQGGDLVTLYSNPNLNWPTGEPLGDPLISDGARAISEAAFGTTGLDGIQDFQTGTPSYPDCDNDEILDVIEIAYGTQIDCDNDGVPDPCQIANNPGDDCNQNGIPDSCDFTDTRYITGSEVSTSVGLTGSVTFSNLPTVRSNSYTISFSDDREYTGIDQIDIYVDSVFIGTILQGVGSSACGNPKSGSITVSNALNTDITEVEYVATGTSIARGRFCANPSWSVQIEYHADSTDDVNRNGIFDPCEPGCTPYDLVSPFGQFTYFDLQQFITWYNNGDLRADFAAPFGELNYFDVNAYNLGYQAGCP